MRLLNDFKFKELRTKLVIKFLIKIWVGMIISRK